LTNTGLILQVGRCRKNFVGPQYDPIWLRSFKSPSNSDNQVRSPGTSSSFKRFSTFAATSTGEYLEELSNTSKHVLQCEKHDMFVGAKCAKPFIFQEKVKVLFWDTPFYCRFCDQLPSNNKRSNDHVPRHLDPPSSKIAMLLHNSGSFTLWILTNIAGQSYRKSPFFFIGKPSIIENHRFFIGKPSIIIENHYFF
jgi:hypothetical protein